MTIPLRSTSPRKHVHLWTITKDIPSLVSYGYLTGISILQQRRLERTCSGCGMKQAAALPDGFDLPPTPLLALADLDWQP